MNNNETISVPKTKGTPTKNIAKPPTTLTKSPNKSFSTPTKKFETPQKVKILKAAWLTSYSSSGKMKRIKGPIYLLIITSHFLRNSKV